MEQARLVIDRLKRAHPDAACALRHENPFQLLVATILSAQCTDERVNMVTPGLFSRYPTPAAMSRATPEALEEIIRSTGFFRNKTKSLRGASERIESEYGGRVPRSMEELLTLPGVARKTANVVLGVAHGIAEGIVVDTHVERVSRRLGLSRAPNPVKIEQELMRAVPREEWILFPHLLIFHGRRTCVARKPRCPECAVRDLCPSAKYFLLGKTPPWERRAEAGPVDSEGPRGKRSARTVAPARARRKGTANAAKKSVVRAARALATSRRKAR